MSAPPRTAREVLPTELWITILRDATELPRAHDTSYHDPIESQHLIHPLKPSGPFLGDHSESFQTKRSAVQVCRLWNIIATPHLYETIQLHNAVQVYLLSRTAAPESASSPSARKLMEYVIRLDLRIESQNVVQVELRRILEMCTNLKIFHLKPLGGRLAPYDWLDLFPSEPRQSLKAIITPFPTPRKRPKYNDITGVISRFTNLDILIGCRLSDVPVSPEKDNSSSSVHTIGPLMLRTSPPSPLPSNESLGLRLPVLRHLVIDELESMLVAVPAVIHVTLPLLFSPRKILLLAEAYNHLTQLTVVCHSRISSTAFPQLERLALSNNERDSGQMYYVLRLIDELIEGGGHSRLKVVRILEGDGERSPGVTWMWSESTSRLAQQREQDEWRFAMDKYALRGVRVEDYNSVPFEGNHVAFW